MLRRLFPFLLLAACAHAPVAGPLPPGPPHVLEDVRAEIIRVLSTPTRRFHQVVLQPDGRFTALCEVAVGDPAWRVRYEASGTVDLAARQVQLLTLRPLQGADRLWTQFPDVVIVSPTPTPVFSGG